MIRFLRIEQFKAFKLLDLEMCTLTVLTGLNSTGKSTVIQAILLAQIASQSLNSVALNGSFGLVLGEAFEVLHSSADNQIIKFQIEGNSGIENVILTVPDDRSVILEMERNQNYSDPRDGHVGTYLSAERLGPRDLLEISAEQNIQIGVGHQGQFTAHAYVQLARQKVPANMLHPTNSLGVTLEFQAPAWLSTIVRPIQIKADWLIGTNAATLRFRNPDVKAEWTRPTNVGFGFSYALPIIVAALTALPDSLLIVENPEAHLHPKGQSEMGRFLARVAASGVQVILETHSDHIINGIRLEVAQNQMPAKNDVIFHFFGAENEVRKIEISGRGALSSWPPDFFDQSERDLGKLTRLPRNV